MIVLDYKEGEGPAAYWDYIEALERLLDNAPTHPDLVAQQEELAAGDPPGRVLVTQDNVATEARHLRKRISGVKCEFPKLAAYIKALRPTHGVAQSTTERLKRQAQDIAALEQRIVVLRSKVAAAELAKEEMSLDLDEARRDLANARS